MMNKRILPEIAKALSLVVSILVGGALVTRGGGDLLTASGRDRAVVGNVVSDLTIVETQQIGFDMEAVALVMAGVIIIYMGLWIARRIDKASHTNAELNP